MKGKKKLFSVALATMMIFSSVSAVSASSTNDQTIPTDTTIPEGYRVVKEYDPSTENTQVDLQNEIAQLDIQVEGDPLLSENSLLQSFDSIPVSNDVDYDIERNETHLYRDLQNVATGEIVQQYKTDMVVAAADPFVYSGSNQNSDKSIKLTISLYYHKQQKNSLTYIGLDKAYWRYDKGSSPNSNIYPSYSNKCTMIQNGPGINNTSKSQSKDCSKIAGDLFFGTTYLAQAPSTWIEVLEGGLATEVGIKVSANFDNTSTGKTFVYSWQLTITGKTPI